MKHGRLAHFGAVMLMGWPSLWAQHKDMSAAVLDVPVLKRQATKLLIEKVMRL